MDDPKMIATVMAAVVAGTVVLGLLGTLTRRWWSAGSWAIVLALAVAPLASDKPFLGQAPPWRSTDPNHDDAAQRIILAGVPLALAAAALSARRWPAWPRALLAVAAPAALVYWIVTAFHAPPPGWRGQLDFAVLASVVVWLLVEPLAARHPTGIAAPWVCGCLAAGVALLNLFGSDTNPAAVALTLGAVMMGAFLLALTGRGPSFAGGPVAVIAPLLACVAVANHLGGGEVTTGQWLLLGLAAVVPWAIELRPMRNWKPWLREPLRMVLVTVPVLMAVVPAHKAWVAQQAAEMGE